MPRGVYERKPRARRGRPPVNPAPHITVARVSFPKLGDALYGKLIASTKSFLADLEKQRAKFNQFKP